MQVAMTSSTRPLVVPPRPREVRANVRALLVCLLRACACALGLAGCHESDLEPASPLRGDWSMRAADIPAQAMSPEVPALYVPDPAPITARPRSVSLGFIGDEPLAPSPVMGPRWPWVQEPFHMRGGYGYGGAYGYGYGGRRYRHRRRWR